MPAAVIAERFVKKLRTLSSPAEVKKVGRFFKGDESGGNKIMGVSVGKVFPVAREFVQAPLAEIEKLLESEFYEVRMGAVSIMDFQARAKSAAPSQRKALYELYIRRHDRINNWDLVDRAAPHVVGRYLMDRPRDILYKLARSPNPWERRTAIVSTYYFILAGQLEDTFRIAQLLLDDDHDLVQKATGSWLREAGKKDPGKLICFLETHTASMPRATLRYAIEKLDKNLRVRFMRIKDAG
jgi:3-methyladenine DNA glycosylase AlkD